MSGSELGFRAWVEKADHDLLNIRNNLVATDIPWDTVCFHAQQAAEKLLKAFLIAYGRDLMRTHDLIALLAHCVEIDPSLQPLEEDCRQLTYFGVSSRYPDWLYEPDERDGREMVAAANRVRAEILERLPKH